MRKSAAIFIAVALFGFASSFHTANAQLLTSPTTLFEAFATDVMDGAAAIIASVEAAVGNLADAITGHAIVASNTASAAEAITPNTPTVNAPEVPTAPNSPVPSSPPTPPTEAQVQPVVQYDAVATPSTDNVFELQGAVSTLTQGVQSLTALFEAQTPSSKIESQIAALQSALSSQTSGQSYNASAYVPLGDGAPNTIAAASNIGSISGAAITNLTASEIPISPAAICRLMAAR